MNDAISSEPKPAEEATEAVQAARHPRAAAPPTPPATPIHNLKTIKWHDVTARIVTQNENGPCPLVAICNVLLLNGKLKLREDSAVIYASELVDSIGNLMLETYPEHLRGPEKLDLEKNLNDAISILPNLVTGLDVNVKFTGVRDFEYTPECIIFDLLRIPLYHGWLVEPDAPEVDVVGSNSYNQLVEKIIRDKFSDDGDKVAEAISAEGFLERTSWQLTYHGLCELHSAMKEEELAVFFRNNHFYTVYRRKDQIMYLVTDMGFLNETNVVWATMSTLEGDCIFLDGEFKVAKMGAAAGADASRLPATVLPNTEKQVDNDYALAVSLAEMEKAKNEEDELAVQKVQLGIPADASDAEIAMTLHQAEQRAFYEQQAKDEERGRQGQGRQRQTPRNCEMRHSRDPQREKRGSSCTIL